jgi:CDP-diacylglycerol--glycerol-3-phosphate 3-phosphatidyltransferase
MRIVYALLKAAALGWVFLLQPWPALDPQLWARWQPQLEAVTAVLVYAAVAMCLLRGAPVLIEFGLAEGRLFHRRPRRGGA